MSDVLIDKDKKEITVPPNTFVVINTANDNVFALEASGDRIIIQEDKMRIGNECKVCDGEGVVNEACDFCKTEPDDKKGKGWILGPDNDKEPCRFCNQPRGLFGQQETQGYKTCPECKGKGALVVLPQTAERRPTTGTVKSIGPDVGRCPQCSGSGRTVIQGVLAQQKTLEMVTTSPVLIPCLNCRGEGKIGLKLQIGDRVMYPIFAGTAINFKQKGTCRIMHENEIMGKIYGMGSLGDIIK